MIDIPVDNTINRNKIKLIKKLPLTIIDDPMVIEKLIFEKNALHLNQAQGTPLLIESLCTKLGDGFASFADNLLTGTADLSTLKLSSNIREYVEKMKKNKKTVKEFTLSTIPYE